MFAAIIVVFTAFMWCDYYASDVLTKAWCFVQENLPDFSSKLNKGDQTVHGSENGDSSSVSDANSSDTAAGNNNVSGDNNANSTADVTVYFLDVGQGTSSLIVSDGEAMLIDGGGRKYSSFVVSYLKSQGITELKYLAASHFDEDHIAGLVGVLYNFTVDTVLEPDYTADTGIYNSYQKAKNEAGLTGVNPSPGDTFSLGSCTLTLTGPTYYGHEDENNESLSFRLAAGNTSFLFMGDTEEESEREILSSGITVDSDVLAVAHHGSASSSCLDFLDAVSPTYGIISVGKDNSYNLPAESVLKRLSQKGITIYRTDECGTITCHSDGNTLTWDMAS